jgi:hypothetical protein
MRRADHILGVPTLTRPAWAAARESGLLRPVLDYCLAHPEPGSALEKECGPLQFKQCAGEAWVVGRAPHYLEITADLLQYADPRRMSFADGVLTLHVLPHPLRYRPRHPVHRHMTVVFEQLDGGMR